VILSLRAMDRILGVDPAARTIRCEPGVLLATRSAPPRARLLLAPDPTSEEESSVGGAVACDASGARSLKYGATGRHVQALTVALVDGTVLELRRPAMEKNVAGFAPVRDLIDWFVGSEGTLGVVLAAEFALLPLPDTVVGLGLPFPTAAQALAFVVEARQARDAGSALQPRCLEYLDAPAFAIAREYAREFVGGSWGEGRGRTSTPSRRRSAGRSRRSMPG
jgi:FAD/FMN-containing dehydrogenase